jgi:CRISP-associated protein Cas1
MEEFRAVVADSAVLTAINNGSITARDFVRAGDAANLTSDGRKAFLEVYEKRVNSTIRHPVFNYQVSYRRAFELQYRLLARALTGELAHYVPFTTR